MFPSSLVSLSGLTALDLSHNYISTLSLNISTLVSLRFLDLSHNLMVGLPPQLVSSLPNMGQLEHLNLAHNRLWDLSTLPAHQLPSLTHLDVSHNRLSNLTPHLSSLNRLQVLDISHNNFSGLNGTLASSISRGGGSCKNVTIPSHTRQGRRASSCSFFAIPGISQSVRESDQVAVVTLLLQPNGPGTTRDLSVFT